MSTDRPKRTIPIALPAVGDEEWQSMREPLRSGWITQGPRVAAFEKAFAERHRVDHALATTSCTTALHLALAAEGIGPGDEVIVPAFTWVATANVVLYLGATPVLADIDPRSFNLDPAEVARRMSPRTRAVIAVHLFGLCAEMDEIRVAADGLPIFEDAACAAGAAYRGRPAGSLGRAAAFSFHPRKAVTTGEGGMFTTGDEDLAARANAMRNHGAEVPEEVRHHGPRPYLLPDFNLLGFNYRMTDMQGAMGLVQLARLDEFIAERQRFADLYAEELCDLPWLRLPEVPAHQSHAWQSHVCLVDADRAPRPRNELMQQLTEAGIGVRPGTHAVHTLGLYRERYGYRAEDYPNATLAERQSLAIPMHNRMTEDDCRYVAEALRSLS